ncbi:inactive leucine-rich repeat receptor-like serine/threonine-protein kinase At1g60630 [Magnolia sinica]|uniref:inactive leucine-rich repeat receptor-like serine/threonine-protein kinase At1g60630 n=1 Tax=Magnolia sinica TaxID=86752 RepID=UPI00265B01D9|nr:inactive leucine-rich repeat receptor-like serine/threonine-protein kinase At1g60630 [Magnolia sinica]
MDLRYFFYLLIFILLVLIPSAKSGDAEALLRLKSSIDPSGSLPWRGSDACGWQGIKECLKGRVTKLVLEYLNLNGSLEEKSLNELDQLRVLSFKGNSISGSIPNLSGLINLKSLFLNDNRLSGGFPSSISSLHRLKVIVLSGNQVSGEIPASLIRVRRLYVLQLQDNRLTGSIPALNQTSLRYFNVSGNRLSGEIPATPALIRFNSSSFLNNLNLCGEQIKKPCTDRNVSSPPSPNPAPLPTTENRNHPQRKKNKKKLAIVVAASIAGFFLLLICLVVLWRICCRGSRDREVRVAKAEGVLVGEGPSGGTDGNNVGGKGGFAWEGEGLGSLIFCGGAEQLYTLEDLLKASAETLGRGTMGSTYKAVMESGFIVTVKRLKDSSYPWLEEFRRQMEVLGRLRHPNLVPVRAYFQAKEERLLVYDYFPNGSLFSLIHGSRPSGGGKPLHWTSCLKIAEDLATGLLYLHQTAGIVHGNLKSSNVLLGSDFESCLTDYGLTPLRSPDSLEDSSGGAASLFYRAPECRHPRKSFTEQSDIYSFGVILLELLTGKTPFQDLVQEHGADIPSWVRSVREEETESGEDPSSGNEASEEKLAALLNVAMACVVPVAENRPAMKDVLRMIREARAEAQVSSNSSDHSPGRWSDTVQGLPRDSGSEHLNFTERD